MTTPTATHTTDATPPVPPAEAAGITATVELVTPALAADLLAHNTRNRRLKTVLVEQLAEALRRGEWQLNGEAVKVAADGTLLDGQHRLTAVHRSGVPAAMLVVRGVSLDAQATMDTGTRRTLGDTFTLAGEPNASILAATLVLLYNYTNNDRWQRVRGAMGGRRTIPTKAQHLAFLDEHPTIRDSVAQASLARSRWLCSRSVVAAAHYLFAQRDPAAADAFLAGFGTGANLEPGAPALALRNYVANHAARGTMPRGDELLGVFVKAWNAERSGRAVRVLVLRNNEPKPEVAP